MNILFLSLVQTDNISQRSIYMDLLREFIGRGHAVYVLSPVERRDFGVNEKKANDEYPLFHSFRVRTGNITKTNLVEKAISTLLIGYWFKRAIKHHFSDVTFDLVLYATPPITFESVIRYVKRRDNAKSYLMLKDIFPQNSVDLGMLTKSGVKGLIYRYFRAKEKRLYAVSDKIGCMSPANVDYILKHNPEVLAEKVELCPNCIEVQDVLLTESERKEMRERHGIPPDKKVFVYGGNLGKPQDVPFIVSCLKACSDLENVFFVIAGSGTDRHILEEYVKTEKPSHLKLFDLLPKDEYDRMIACCDIGLIFLDHRFTIPNFPSRLLSYMQAGLPVLACTDPNTDIGKEIVDGGFGWWCESDDANGFGRTIEQICCTNTDEYGNNAISYLKTYYASECAYQIIMS